MLVKGAPGMISEEDAFRTILDMFGAGTETMNTTLQWLFIYLMYNTTVQDRCREEIYEVMQTKHVDFFLKPDGEGERVKAWEMRNLFLQVIDQSHSPLPGVVQHRLAVQNSSQTQISWDFFPP